MVSKAHLLKAGTKSVSGKMPVFTRRTTRTFAQSVPKLKGFRADLSCPLTMSMKFWTPPAVSTCVMDSMASHTRSFPSLQKMPCGASPHSTLSCSILAAHVTPKYIHHKDITQHTKFRDIHAIHCTYTKAFMHIKRTANHICKAHAQQGRHAKHTHSKADMQSTRTTHAQHICKARAHQSRYAKHTHNKAVMQSTHTN